MANKKIFDEPVQTTVKIEATEKALAKYFKLNLTDCTRHGLYSFVMIEMLRRNDVPKEIVDAYEAAQAKFLQTLRAKFQTAESREKMQEFIRLVSANVNEKIEAHSTAMKDIIRVWNSADERYEEIPAPLFDPTIHKLVVKQSELEADDGSEEDDENED